MDLKQRLMQEGMKLMSNPRVMKLMQDERVMKVVMGAMSLPGKISTFTENAGEKIAKTMHMATAQEVKDLKRTLRKLEEQLESMRKSNGSNGHG
jgi:cell division FtsZ-interacting protein ZapD